MKVMHYNNIPTAYLKTNFYVTMWYIIFNIYIYLKNAVIFKRFQIFWCGHYLSDRKTIMVVEPISLRNHLCYRLKLNCIYKRDTCWSKISEIDEINKSLNC